jgi:hypothetical protein
MRSRTSTWFETKVRYEKTMDDGMEKKVTEQYVVDALSFTEAEGRAYDLIHPYVTGDMDIRAIKRAPYGEVFFSDKENDDKWYKAKLQFITIDDKTEKEKRSNVYYLVQADTIARAKSNLDEVMKGTMIDYEIVSITETPTMDVFDHNPKK